jgi:hypothetical protein
MGSSDVGGGEVLGVEQWLQLASVCQCGCFTEYLTVVRLGLAGEQRVESEDAGVGCAAE